MIKSNCATCKYLEIDEAGSWMDISFKNVPARFYCTMRPNWLQFLKNNNCEFYEQRREKKGTC